jgi:23S rRNA G2445 N2-methylase RlmL
MNFYTQKNAIVITCNRRLSPYLQQEVMALGYTPTHIFATGLELEGTMQDCIKLNLNLRSASQILLSIKYFYCDHPEDLYDELIKIEWDTILAVDTYFSITSNVYHDSINNSMYANVKVKDAIVDYFKQKNDTRPSTGSAQDKAVFHLHWKNQDAEIFIDTSGETLAKHGYRRLPGKAPMIESLAACTILAGNWNKKTNFINPMCGSGTLAIEAALMASNRVPGLLRNNYGFMHLLGYDATVYAAEMEIINQQIIPVSNTKIIASDLSAQAIDIAKVNANLAEVEDWIDFQVCDFTQTQLPDMQDAVVYINPEYGERLGEEEALLETYQQMGDFLKQHCKGSTAYIFTGNLELAKKIGLKANKRIEFYNGKIDCRLLEYDLYDGTKRKVMQAQNGIVSKK